MVDEEENDRPDKIVSFGRSDDTPDKSKTRSERDELVSIRLDEWTHARESLARLESKMESAKEDVRRAVEYARELEQECDRIAAISRKSEAAITEAQNKLERERGRRQELEEQYQFVLEKLEEMSGIRGRYHLERVRREEADEKNGELTEEIQDLKQQLKALSSALEEAHKRGFKAELGPLIVELKR